MGIAPTSSKVIIQQGNSVCSKSKSVLHRSLRDRALIRYGVSSRGVQHRASLLERAHAGGRKDVLDLALGRANVLIEARAESSKDNENVGSVQ